MPPGGYGHLVVVGLAVVVLLTLVNLVVIAVFTLFDRRRDAAREEEEKDSRLDHAALEMACPRLSAAEVDASDGLQACSICLGVLVAEPDEDALESAASMQLRRLCCGHLFHAECIDVWLSAGRNCAVCRTPQPGVRQPAKAEAPSELDATQLGRSHDRSEVDTLEEQARPPPLSLVGVF